MATTLAHPATGAFCLTGMADLIATDWTNAAVLRAGALAAGPAGAAAAITIVQGANGARRNATTCTQNILASGALFDARIADDMAVAVERHLHGFLPASITGRTPQGAAIAIAAYTDRSLAFAVT